jgi:hypothetical protein
MNEPCCGGVGCSPGLDCTAGRCEAPAPCGGHGQRCCEALDCHGTLVCNTRTVVCGPAPETPSGSTLCTETCEFAGDDECDDGGADAITALCEYGTDCRDCGPRGAAGGGGATEPGSGSDAGPGDPGGCTDTCEFADDGECDDGGDGAMTDLCAFGTDCADCGARAGGTSGGTDPSDPTDPTEAPGCTHTCEFADDGECDDGGPESDYDYCDLGTDCNDCGPRDLDGDPGPDPGPDPDAWICSDRCRYADDGMCDDGGPGSEYSLCAFGTDCADCGARDPADAPLPPAPLCGDECEYASDGECDDGGPGSDYSLCPLGTDCADCGPREADGPGDPYDGEVPACGGEGDACCAASGSQCDERLHCNEDGRCERPTGCGILGNACCLGICGEGVCDFSTYTCEACGGLDDVCCPIGICNVGRSCNWLTSRCVSCGGFEEPCCPGASCDAGLDCSLLGFTCQPG